MKLLSQNFTNGGDGTVKLLPEEGEDLWHVYNLVRDGDHLTATTFRKVAVDSGLGGESERIKIKLTLEVDGVDFDPEGSSMRVRGTNQTECEFVKLGAHHTLELEPQRPFTLWKSRWDGLDVDRIAAACNPQASADLAALLITEGLANLVLVGGSISILKAKVEASLPRKRGAAALGYDKAWTKFMEAVFTAVIRHVDFAVVKCLVIAGPGFAKDSFREFLDAEAVRREIRPLIEHRDRILVAPASSAFKHSLKEVLACPLIASRIKNTKAARETQALQQFYDMLSNDPSRAFYGPAHVEAAGELGAVQTLLISDSLFRMKNVAARARYAALVEAVRAAGGDALIFSAMHLSGEALNQLSGIAAILRFPLPELEELEMGDDGTLGEGRK
ncbi:MAG: hypothetical protein WDW36_001381 [Sanguina aurantia]